MQRRHAIILALLLVPFGASAGGKHGTPMNVTQSQHNVSETIDRLEAALRAKGIGVVARVDHAAGATSVGMKLSPTELLIFGNPKLGTPLMQSDPRAGFDLPLRALAWEDAQGKTWLGVTRPELLAKRYDLKGREEILEKMTQVLKELSEQATGKPKDKD